MSDKHDLRMYVVPPGRGASFRFTREGGLALLRALSPMAEKWLAAHIGEEASWHQGALVVEPRYVPEIVDGIIDAGFLFEGDEDDAASH
jgi:hypothetical protein